MLCFDWHSVNSSSSVLFLRVQMMISSCSLSVCLSTIFDKHNDNNDSCRVMNEQLNLMSRLRACQPNLHPLFHTPTSIISIEERLMEGQRGAGQVVGDSLLYVYVCLWIIEWESLSQEPLLLAYFNTHYMHINGFDRRSTNRIKWNKIAPTKQHVCHRMRNRRRDSKHMRFSHYAWYRKQLINSITH